MSVTVVRYQTTPEAADENQALIEKVFTALAVSRPAGLRYTSLRLADGVSFVHIAAVDTADGTNPLLSTPAFSEFVSGIGDRVVDGPTTAAATVVGSYQFFGDQT